MCEGGRRIRVCEGEGEERVKSTKVMGEWRVKKKEEKREEEEKNKKLKEGARGKRRERIIVPHNQSRNNIDGEGLD